MKMKIEMMMKMKIKMKMKMEKMMKLVKRKVGLSHDQEQQSGGGRLCKMLCC